MPPKCIKLVNRAKKVMWEEMGLKKHKNVRNVINEWEITLVWGTGNDKDPGEETKLDPQKGGSVHFPSRWPEIIIMVLPMMIMIIINMIYHGPPVIGYQDDDDHQDDYKGMTNVSQGVVH